MKKYLHIFTAFFAVSLPIFAANVSEIVDENFENGFESQLFLGAETRPDLLKIASGSEAIDGGKSLLLDFPSDSKIAGNVVNVIRLGPLKRNAVYLFEVRYRAVKKEKFSPFGIRLTDAKGNSLGTLLPNRTMGVSLTFKEGLRVPDKAGKFYFSLAANRGSVTVIDNLKITEIVPDAVNSYLFCEPHHWHKIFTDKTFPGMYFSPTAYAFLDPHSPILDMPREKFFPFIDKWGQYKYSEWPNKIHSDAELAAAHEKEVEFYKKSSGVPNRDKYGALENSCGDFKPTGRFCLDKVDGKWMLRAPNGNLFWAFGINSVGGMGGTITTGREHFFDDIKPAGKLFKYKHTSPIRGYPEDARPDGFNLQRRVFFWKYGLKSNEEFNAKIKEISDWRISNWGFNTYGAWTLPWILENPARPFICNTDRIKVLSTSRKYTLQPDVSIRKMFRAVPDTFDVRVEKLARESLKKIEKLLKSEYCVGVFVDNEVPWEMKDRYTAEAVLVCPPSQPAKIGMKKFLSKRYGGDIEKLNAAWNSKYADWDAFLNECKFIPSTKKSETDLQMFDDIFHARYFKMCRDAVKEISPDCLYMGSRFAWRNSAAVRAAAKYCDVVSFNLYISDISDFKMYDCLADKPLAIGEFSFSRSDYGHFWKGPRAAANGKDQIALFNNYMKSVLKHPNFVSACWFTYSDQPTTARADGENAAFGIIDICDTPHYDMVSAVRKMARKLYRIRLGSSK